MRRLLLTAILLASPALTAPASALDGSDSMGAWKRATESERSAFLKQLFGDQKKPGLRDCMDETSKTPGHADLPIADVAKVCASAGNAGQPV